MPQGVAIAPLDGKTTPSPSVLPTPQANLSCHTLIEWRLAPSDQDEPFNLYFS